MLWIDQKFREVKISHVSEHQLTATHNHRATVREAGSWDGKPHRILRVLSVRLQLPLSCSQQLLGRLLNGFPLSFFSCFVLAYSNRQTPQPSDGAAKQPLEKSQSFGTDPKAAGRARSHERLAFAPN